MKENNRTNVPGRKIWKMHEKVSGVISACCQEVQRD